MKKILITVISFCAVAASAQTHETDLVELLRKDLQTEKVKIITDVMEFSKEESAAFWPVYNEYEAELTKINDQRLANIKDYAEHFDKMTDDKAKELVAKALNLENERTQLLKKYFDKWSKVLPVKTAARFMQVENQILKLLDVEIAQQLPLVY